MMLSNVPARLLHLEEVKPFNTNPTRQPGTNQRQVIVPPFVYIAFISIHK
jgi:hypothetical protein